MEFNFNKIKRLMQGDNKDPLPPELDWNNMKDGILEKMQSLEKEASSQNETPPRRRGLFLLLLIVLAVGLIAISQTSKEDRSPEAQVVVSLPKTDVHQKAPNQKVPGQSASNQSTSNQTDKAAPANRVDKLEEPPEPEEQLTEKQENSKVNAFASSFESSIPRRAPKKTESAQMADDPSPTYVQGDGRDEDLPSSMQPADRAETIQSTTETTQEALTTLAEETNRPDVTSENLIVQRLLTGISYNSGFESIRCPLLDLPEPDSVNRPVIDRSRPVNQLVLEGGITFWDKGYGNNEPENAQYETPLPSFQLQGYYMGSIDRNYFLMAGIQYQELESRLRYNNIIGDYTVTLTDTIVRVERDPTTGQHKVIRGDVEQTLQAERRVRHYNKTRLFKLSLGVGRSWRFHSFQTDVYLGGALNSVAQNQGRMVYDEAVVDYSGTSNAYFQNQWTVEGILGVRLHYFLNPKLGITTGFQAQKSLTNWSNQNGINYYPASFSLQLGLSYSL